MKTKWIVCEKKIEFGHAPKSSDCTFTLTRDDELLKKMIMMVSFNVQNDDPLLEEFDSIRIGQILRFEVSDE